MAHDAVDVASSPSRCLLAAPCSSAEALIGRLELVRQVAAADLRARAAGYQDSGVGGLPTPILAVLAQKERAAAAVAAASATAAVEAARREAVAVAAEQEAKAGIRVGPWLQSPPRAAQQVWRPAGTSAPASSRLKEPPAAASSQVRWEVLQRCSYGVSAGLRGAVMPQCEPLPQAVEARTSSASSSAQVEGAEAAEEASDLQAGPPPPKKRADGTEPVRGHESPVAGSSEADDYEAETSEMEASEVQASGSAQPVAGQQQPQTEPAEMDPSKSDVVGSSSAEQHPEDLRQQVLEQEGAILASSAQCSSLVEVGAGEHAMAPATAVHEEGPEENRAHVVLPECLHALQGLFREASDLIDWYPCSESDKLEKAALLADLLPQLLDSLTDGVVDSVLLDTVAEMTRLDIERAWAPLGSTLGGAAANAAKTSDDVNMYLDQCVRFEEELRYKYLFAA